MPDSADRDLPVEPSPEIRRAPEPKLDGFVTATALYLLHKCDRRLWLARHRPELAAPEGEFDRLLRSKGVAHEQQVRDTIFPDATPPIFHGQPLAQAAAETLRLIGEGARVLYQPVLLAADEGRAGVPDFLYRDGDGLVVHDAKLAVNLGQHAEIPLQMTHYAHLLERATGRPPARLEITNGNLDIVALEPCAAGRYEEAARRAAALVRGGPEPGTLRTHSVCAECGFYGHCWPQAVAEDRIEVLPAVTSAVAPRLHALGFHTIAALAAAAPERIRVKGVAASAEAIAAEARAHHFHRPEWREPPDLPPYPVVWFDLEGDPGGEELDKAIYLWGLALDDGAGEPEPQAILADFDDDGGRRAWERFVTRAGEILEAHPGARWVHYSPYEKTWLRHYVERYGAPAGFAERMEDALFDLLHRGVRPAVRLPLYSYSIKKVADYVGFRWRDPESGSAWSIVQYQKARAAGEGPERRRLVEAIVDYNRDDLEAMRQVWRWMLANGPRARCG